MTGAESRSAAGDADTGGGAPPGRETEGGGRRAGARVLAAYLGLAAVPLLTAGPGGAGSGPRWATIVVGHLALLAWTVALARGRRPTGALGVVADWLPLLAIPALYAELPVLMAGVPGADGYFDPMVQRLETALFGGQPAFEMAAALPWRPLSEILHLSYLLFYPLIYVPPILLYLGLTGPASGDGDRAARTAFHRTVGGVVLSMTACYLVFVVFPVQGPRYLGVPRGVPDGPVRALALLVLETGSSRGAAFPSSHVAVAVTQTVLALRWQPRVGAVLALVTVGLAFGAVYGGFHYAVDALAGVPVGLVAALAVLRLKGRNSPSRAGFTSSPGPV